MAEEDTGSVSTCTHTGVRWEREKGERKKRKREGRRRRNDYVTIMEARSSTELKNQSKSDWTVVLYKTLWRIYFHSSASGSLSHFLTLVSLPPPLEPTAAPSPPGISDFLIGSHLCP